MYKKGTVKIQKIDPKNSPEEKVVLMVIYE
jgi:hypothetical protein